MQDRNFDDIAEKFSRNIYGTTKGQIRQAILWQELDALLKCLPPAPLRVLDAGGGAGQTACRLAEYGHHVLLCDISAEMLRRARALALEKGVSDRMQFRQISAQQIVPNLAGTVDLVLLHAVLEWVAEPQSLLKSMYDVLKPGGILSLMFYNKHSLTLRALLLGNFNYLQQTNKRRRGGKTLSPDYPCDPQQVYQWLQECDFTLENRTGIRVFHDYMYDKQKQTDCFADVLAMEKRYCRQEPFLSLGRYIHVSARKPLQRIEE